MNRPAAGEFALSPAPVPGLATVAGGGTAAVSDARPGIVMLCHDNLELAARMARLWTDGGAVVAIHVDRSAPAGDVARMQQALAGHPVVFTRRRTCNWGTFSLVAATLDAAASLLACWPDVSHVMLVSGACLPLRPVSELQHFLSSHPGTDFIESVSVVDVGWTVGGLNEERFTLRFPFAYRRNRKFFDRCVRLQRRLGITRTPPRGVAPHIGSQWWCLTRRTLQAILDDPRRREFDRYFRQVWIPDESYFQTLVRRHSARIESRSLTLAKFDGQGKPYIFYDDHLGLLERSRVFVARKIWPGASALYARFPRPAGHLAEPDSERVETVLDRAAARHRRGRAGLYMQSRFPRKDAEGRKTSQPYVVLHGVADLFLDLPAAASAATGRVVHGHILARNEVEFAAGAPVGPGALSSVAGLRDLDPRGFLAALIRSSPTLPAFLHSPRDRQHLDWFMVTDPNARLLVVTGAWMVPLLRSEMPFDDTRRMAAILRRSERRFLDALDSVWVKARVRRWTLDEALSRPDEIWDAVCTTLRPDEPLSGAAPPPLHDTSGLGPLIRRLRNAGLKPH